MKPAKKYEIVYPEDIPALIKDAKEIAIDTETTGLSYPQSDVVYLTFSTKEDNGYIVRVDGFYPEVAQLLTQMTSEKIFHGRLFDDLMLRKYGYKLHKVGFDTQIASYILSPVEPHKLKYIARQLLGENPQDFKDLFKDKKGKDGKKLKITDYNIKDLDIQEVINYACDDVNNTLRLRPHLEAELRKDPNDWRLFQTDLKVSEVLTDMVEDGMAVDSKVLHKTAKICKREMKKAEIEIQKYLGAHVNINSPKQLAKVLFQDLLLPVVGLTKTGEPQTDAECLKYLKDDHPVIEHLLIYKEHDKILGTYIEPILAKIDENGLLHGYLNQTRTATGRLSSSEPNLQNIPAHSKVGKMIRQAFVSRYPEGRLIVVDQSQFEIRILAAMSKEPLMLKAFKKAKEKGEKIDYHQIKADDLGVSRHEGKTLNFAMIYGKGKEGLATALNITEKAANRLLERDKATYKGVSKWKKARIQFAKDQGYATTILGRKLYLGREKYHGTCGVNYPIQGSAGDLMKLSMIMIQDHIKRMDFKTKMVMQVHDELIFDCPNDEEEKLLLPYIIQAMEHPKWGNDLVDTACPLEADVKIVSNWAQAKEG